MLFIKLRSRISPKTIFILINEFKNYYLIIYIMETFSQVGQDRWVIDILNNKIN